MASCLMQYVPPRNNNMIIWILWIFIIINIIWIFILFGLLSCFGGTVWIITKCRSFGLLYSGDVLSSCLLEWSGKHGLNWNRYSIYVYDCIYMSFWIYVCFPTYLKSRHTEKAGSRPRAASPGQGKSARWDTCIFRVSGPWIWGNASSPAPPPHPRLTLYIYGSTLAVNRILFNTKCTTTL